uniref:MYND-type domain-containing protein n=1 Tax=Mycena chlorophos TaxID=658473 RepID=A0ABQ0KZ76_MYCCL|nr:predicted protein [Mycena chlorophos]
MDVRMFKRTFITAARSACGYCQTPLTDLKACSGCSTIRYCSKSCQKKHWPAHKKDCKPRSETVPPGYADELVTAMDWLASWKPALAWWALWKANLAEKDASFLKDRVFFILLEERPNASGVRASMEVLYADFIPNEAMEQMFDVPTEHPSLLDFHKIPTAVNTLRGHAASIFTNGYTARGNWVIPIARIMSPLWSYSLYDITLGRAFASVWDQEFRRAIRHGRDSRHMIPLVSERFRVRWRVAPYIDHEIINEIIRVANFREANDLPLEVSGVDNFSTLESLAMGRTPASRTSILPRSQPSTMPPKPTNPPPPTTPPSTQPPPAQTVPVVDFLSPAQVAGVLAALSDEKLDVLALSMTVFSTSDGPIAMPEGMEKMLAECTVKMDGNSGYRLYHKNEPIEICVVTLPRSTQSFNNGIAGNFAHDSWKDGAHGTPNAVKFSYVGNDKYEAWTKKTYPPDNKYDPWSCIVFKSTFNNNPRQFEYSYSGTPVPVVLGTVRDMFNNLDKRVADFAKAENKKKKAAMHGPHSNMFLSGRRPVFVNKSAFLLDEGVMSEYDDPFKIMRIMRDHDVRFNRIPEVLVYDATKKTDVEMSFHGIHMLPPGSVIAVTLYPYIYLSKQEVQWEFRLASMRIIGQREAAAQGSPSKLTIKRKFVPIDDDDDVSPTSSPTAPKRGAAAGGSGAGGS